LSVVHYIALFVANHGCIRHFNMTLNGRRSPAIARADRRSALSARASRESLSGSSFLVALGLKVRGLRREHALSRKMLAELAEVSERYLAQLESGTGNASIVLLRRVAAALNVRVTYLLDSESSAQRAQVSRFIDSLPEERLADVMRRLQSEFGADESVRRKRIALIGLRGAGKSTLGNALAKALRRQFIELDHEIEREAGMPLAEVFMLYGQPGYRNLERRCLDRLIARQTDMVVSVGGGVVSDTETYQLLLGNCFAVWLKASPAEHMSRVVAQGDMRPMRGHAQAMDDLKAILAAREPQYARADSTVDTSGQTVARSLAALRLAVSGGKDS
jgi:XRE family transcriptional regulator, aerobic/anaerobic benzoate catabolism transcriptional regulator